MPEGDGGRMRTATQSTAITARRGGAWWLVALGLALALGLGAPDALATETDQFTLPPKPLDDLGPDMGAAVLTAVREGVVQLNADIAERRLRNPKAELEPGDERKLATYIYEEIGTGAPEAKMERILRYGNYDSRNVRFVPSYFDTIYVWRLLAVPARPHHLPTA